MASREAPVRANNVRDRSGSIAVGGTSQILMPENRDRMYLLIQNISDADLWVDFATAAVVGRPSIKIVAGAVYTLESNTIITTAINIIGATAGKEFVAKEAF